VHKKFLSTPRALNPEKLKINPGFKGFSGEKKEILSILL
jgi:hypothetical protein